MQKTIIVEVSETGQITIKAVGFKGNACEKATRAIELALGKVTRNTRTPDFDLKNITNQNQGL